VGGGLPLSNLFLGGVVQPRVQKLSWPPKEGPSIGEALIHAQLILRTSPPLKKEGKKLSVKKRKADPLCIGGGSSPRGQVREGQITAPLQKKHLRHEEKK